MAKPRGGHQQRRKQRHGDDVPELSPESDRETFQLKRSRHAPLPSESPTPLFLWLISQWSSGVLSAPATQRAAKAAVLSSCSAPDVAKIARVGGHGNSPQNCQRDLVNQFCQDMTSPESFCWKVPLLKRDNEELTIKIEKCDVHLLLPHDWLACLTENDTQAKMLGTHLSEQFWSAQRLDDPKLHNNAVLQIPQYRQLAIPFLVHGDGAQFAERDSLMVISMKSVLSSQVSVAASQFLLAAIPKKATSKSQDKSLDTWEVIWSVLKWSFSAMFHGAHPDCDPNGAPWPEGSHRSLIAGKPLLASGIRGWIYTLAGDLDYLCNHYRLEHFGSNSPCFFCDCNWQDISPFDFRANA